jgi:hypothetical protein
MEFVTETPAKNQGSAIGSSAVGGGGAGRIPASRPRSRPGRRWGTNTYSPRARGERGVSRETSGDGARRRPAVAPTAGGGPGVGRAMLCNGWRRKLLWLLGSRPAGLVAPEKGRGGELTVGRQWWKGGGRRRVGKGDGSVFIGAVPLVTSR